MIALVSAWTSLIRRLPLSFSPTSPASLEAFGTDREHDGHRGRRVRRGRCLREVVMDVARDSTRFLDGAPGDWCLARYDAGDHVNLT
ncbi:hypothetical protein AB0D34_44065 [Streptomyces sp. NPDC048420]|uniref:hypothetical protein n=1 Tax=Streptomyces sp. NPDC048420 TaxID=3155755 RepID=UPI00342E494B